MAIIFTLVSAENFEGQTLNLLIGPWIGAAGAVFGAISSKLERKEQPITKIASSYFLGSQTLTCHLRRTNFKIPSNYPY